VVQSTDFGPRDQTVSFRSEAFERRDDLLRLRFYGHIAEQFAHEHAATLAAGYAASGAELPDFARLSRPQAAAEIAAFATRARTSPSAVVARALDLLTRGLLGLDPALVPLRWL
jgi:hypothetical protein